MIKEYIAHLRDNPQRLWFKRKLYGWGWTPATWQGWLAVALYIVAITLEARSFSAGDTVSTGAFIARIVVATFLLIGLCFAKGERPRWQWGQQKE